MHLLPRLTRRRFLAALGGAALLGLYTWRVEPHWVEVVHRDMPIPNLPDHLVGKTLVQLSDLHVGPRVESAYIQHSLRLVNQLRPDLVCITGDFMTCDQGEQIDEVARVMSLSPSRRWAASPCWATTITDADGRRCRSPTGSSPA